MSKVKVILTSLTVMAFFGASVTPTIAYPPGRKLVIVLSKDMIDVAKGKTNLSIANAIPGNVTISIGNSTPLIVRQKGFYTQTLSAKDLNLKSGINIVKVTSPLGAGRPDEIASAKLYIPGFVAPTAGKISKKLVINFNYVKPGTTIAVTPYTGSKKGTSQIVKVKLNSTTPTSVTLPARTFLKGKKNSYKIDIGVDIHFTYKFTGS